MAIATLKLENKDTNEIITKQLELNEPWNLDTRNQIKSAFVEMITGKVSSIILFNEIEYMGKYDVIHSLITNLRSDIENNSKKGHTRILYLNTFSINLFLS